jgi:DNA-binding SARP family transcriptional activator
MMELRLLGTLAILPSRGVGPPLQLTQPKRIAVLLYLSLAEPPGVQSRQILMALLWPEADDESARHSLRNALYGLRQALGESAIIAHGDGYVGLDHSAVRCDALDVRRLLAERKWEQALSAWSGELAPGFHVAGAPDFERWLDEQRSSLRRAITKAAWHRVDELERSGDAAVVPAARRAWALDPVDEVGARRLLVILDAKVGKVAALRAYDEMVEQLRNDFDSEPSPETRALATHLKARADPRPAAVAAVLSAVTSAREVRVDGDRVPSSALEGAIGAVPRHRRRKTIGIACAVLLMAATMLLALRPARSAVETLADNPVAKAEHEGTLRLAAKYRQDTGSYGAYLRSVALRFQGKNDASRDTLIALVARNPLYAPGYAGLAHAYLIELMSGAISSAEGYPKAEAAALKAIALDSNVASAYFALGMVQSGWRWDIHGAGVLLNRGVALDPHDPEGHILRGNWFKWQLEADSALAEYRIASAVDPLDSSHRDRVARALLLAGHAAEAESMYRHTLQEYPSQVESYVELSEVYRYTGRPLEALNTLRAGWTVEGDSEALSRWRPATSDSDAARVFADVAREDLRQLEKEVRAGEWVPMESFADAHAALQDTAQTLRWLDSMVSRHDYKLCCVRLQPQYNFLRNDPRYKAWEARLPWVARGAALADSAR